jgi:uncharacterized protein involved in exopolysaccharide biosynthesis
MKRILRFLARLYPPSWRKRYGAEFEALLEDATPSARDAFDVFWGALKMQMTTWSLGRIMLSCSVAGILVAVAVSLALPVHYLSQTVLNLQPDEVSKPTGQSASSLLNLVESNAFNREFLTSVILEHNLYPHERARMPLDDVIDKMKRNITLEATPYASPAHPDTLTFVVQFDYFDAHVAERVNEELISRLLESHATIGRQLNSNWIFRVNDPPSLPLMPAVPNRMQFGAVGLFTGLLAGLALAVVVRSRRGTAIENG